MVPISSSVFKSTAMLFRSVLCIYHSEVNSGLGLGLYNSPGFKACAVVSLVLFHICAAQDLVHLEPKTCVVLHTELVDKLL